jgi:phage tail sheath protein FI
MPANTSHVGVRTFLETIEKQPFLIADMSTIGGAFTPGTGIDRDLFPPDTPVHFTTDDAAYVAGAGTGTLRQTIDACLYEGITASIVASVPDILADDDIDEQMGKIVGSASAQSGLWALLAAESETGVAPDILIAPGYTSQRLAQSANPAATAIDALCNRIITAVGVCDTPSTNKTDAVEWAADFSETMNLIAIGQAVRVQDGASQVVRPASPSVAALIAKTDKARGGPYYNPGNQALTGILGPSRPVGFRIDDPDCEANFLIQRGVNSLVQITKNRTSRATNSPQGKTFWGFFNTSSDPLWRAINVVRTRKCVREVIPRTLVRYIGKNLGAHLVTVLLQSVDDFLSELKGLPEPAILGGEVRWDRSINSNATMRVGGLNVRLNFEEAPPLVDLGVYTGRYEHAFNILADEIEAAMAQYQVRGSLTAA